MYEYRSPHTDVHVTTVADGIKKIHIVLHVTLVNENVDQLFAEMLAANVVLRGFRLVVHIENGPNVAKSPEMMLLMSIIGRLHTLKTTLEANDILIVVIQCNTVNENTKTTLAAMSKLWSGTPVRVVQGGDAACKKMIKWMGKNGFDVSARDLA